jgi:hypothetical protein
MSSTPPHTPPPPYHPGDRTRIGHRLRRAAITGVAPVNIVVAAAVIAAIAAGPGILQPPVAPEQLSPAPTTARGVAIMLTSADPIDIAQGISITPVPGWTLADQGPNWVILADADAGARMRVVVKPGGGTDVAAVLQADVDNELARTVLTNVTTVGEPKTKLLQSPKFQQAARMDYTADNTVGLETTHLLGVFMELLNTSNQLSAFIDYRESSTSPSQIGGAAQTMINSML